MRQLHLFNDARQLPRLLDEAFTHVERGQRLRARLEARRRQLLAELEQVSAALAAIPVVEREGLHATPVELDKLSMPDAVLLTLSDAAQWLPATEVRVRIEGMGRVVEPTLLHSALHRLAKAGRISSRGDRGSREYHLGEKEAG